MANRDTITRSGKGTALTHSEMDQNFFSLTGDVDEVTDNYVVLFTDQNKTIQVNKGTSITITLSAISTIRTATDVDDFRVTIKNIGAGLCTITSNAADDIDGTSGAASITLKQWSSVTLQTTTGADWVTVGGDDRTNNNTWTGNNTFNEDVTLSTANLVVSSGNGIDFSATSDASGKTSELFDDYEEGTFTPTIEGTTSGEATYGTPREGFYTKIGNAVTIQLAVKIATSGTMSGNIKVGGLPFSEGAFGNGASVSVGYGDALNTITAGYNLGGRVQGAAINMNIWNAATGIAALSTALLSADGHFELTATYYV